MIVMIQIEKMRIKTITQTKTQKSDLMMMKSKLYSDTIKNSTPEDQLSGLSFCANIKMELLRRL